MNIPRPEYPRPQLRRCDWRNLNGQWQFEIDFGKSGRDRGLIKAEALKGEITVPFCPESKLSGVEYKDFMPAVWYRREVEISEAELEGGKRVILNIGACDWKTEVYVNGESVGTHIGGYVAFGFDITDKLTAGKNVITIVAEDATSSGLQPVGKQSKVYYSHGCDYTRTTGIWQTVWLESVPASYIVSTRYTPDISACKLYVEAKTKNADGMTLRLEAKFGGKTVGYTEAVVHGDLAVAEIKLDELHLWGAGEPNLYDLTLTLGEDKVASYFGMREIVYKNGKFYLNGKPIFERLILDQGFYPDGIYTAPTDEELDMDIVRSMDMGFNGARLHQKIFEPRFLYHADLRGYLVWGEHGSWGLNIDGYSCYEGFIPEWIETIERDYCHPSIVGWCPLNETHKGQNNQFLRTLYDLTKALDNTRPIIDTSGYVHVKTDVPDEHDYDQNPETLAARYLPGGEREHVTFVSEYGGIWWKPQDPDNGWGYGNRPKDAEEWIARYKGLTDALLDNPHMAAFCYTQLTDIEQEVNGLYYYTREPKFDPAILKPITSRQAAVEKE